jgi:hypothetical protein
MPHFSSYLRALQLPMLLATASIAQAQRAATFGAVTTYSTGGSQPNSIVGADVNGDGQPDLLTANYNTSTVGVLLGTGTRSFSAVTTFSTGLASNPLRLAVADVNGDSKPDLLTANQANNTGGVLLNTTPGVVLGTLAPTTKASAGLVLFPNPASHRTAVLTGSTPGQAMQVVDVLGRVTTTTTVDTTGTAALGELAPGLYLVRAGSRYGRLTVE